MSTQNVYEVMNELINKSGKNAKETILKNNKGNAEFREALEFLLNPYIVTGISTKKMNKEIKSNGNAMAVPITLSAVMDYLKNNNSGRDLDVLTMQAFIGTLETEELQTFAKKFITKDLKLGVSEKTVNKMYGADTIPTFAVMLAESYAKKKDKIKGKFYITLKLDGNRCVAIAEPTGVKFFSRKGQAIEGMIELEEQLSKLPYGVYDGELLLENPDSLPSAELFRATQKIVRKDGVKKGLIFNIFDIVTITEFKNGKSIKTYEQRRNTLDEVIEPKTKKLDNVLVLPVMYVGNDHSVIPAYAQAVENDGYEGLMINTANGLYQNKRVNDLQKVKTMKSADLLVMSIEKAIDGQFEGLLSRVNVEYKGGLCGVGSGFTLEQRKYFIENPDEIAGKIIEVQFFEESQDEKTGQLSLRFPVFKCIRTDKGVDDIRYE